MKRLGPHIRTSGRAIPYSPTERNHALIEFNAFVHRFNVPSIFFTVAPDDVHSVLALRLSFPILCPRAFPAKTSESFLDALERGQHGDEQFDPSCDCDGCPACQHTYKIPLKDERLRAYIEQDPVASAEIFKLVIETLYAELFGIPVESPSVRKTKSGKSRGLGGVFGNVTAVVGVIEAQARDALHGHCGLFGGCLPCDLLQKVAAFRDLRAKVIKIIEGMFRSQMTPSEHLIGMVDRVKGRKVTPHAFRPAPLPGCPLPNGVSFESTVTSIQGHKQVHGHRETCHHGAAGEFGCRMAMSQPLVESTRCIQIDPDTEPLSQEEQTRGKRWIPNTLATIEEENYEETRKDRDYQVNPIPARDKRCIMWQLGRPEIPAHEPGFLDSLAELPASVRGEIDEMSDDHRFILFRALVKRNGSLVEINETISATLGCNTANYLLGGIEQAKATIFYLAKYLAKDKVQLAHCLTVVAAARDHIKRFPSTASDAADSSTREVQYFLQRILNQLAGSMEVADTQVAACLLGQKSFVATHATWFVYAWPAVSHVRKVLRDENPDGAVHLDDSDEDDPGTDPSAGSSEEDEDEDGEYIIRDEDRELDVDDLGFALDQENSDTNARSDGSKTSYISTKRNKEGVSVAVPQHTHYDYRGIGLEKMNFHEHTCIVKIVPITERGEKATSSSRPQGQGRQKNACFPFAEGHPLKESHCQQLRSKHLVPVLAGARPPRYPGRKPAGNNPGWRRAAGAFALYFMTLFSPWNLETHTPKGGVKWKDFCAYMQTMEHEDTCFVNRCRAQQIAVVARSLVTNTRVKKATTAMRHSAATRWTGCDAEPDYSGDFQRFFGGIRGDGVPDQADSSGSQKEQEMSSAATEEVNALLDRANLDQGRIDAANKRHADKQRFIDHSVHSLNRVFGPVVPGQGRAGGAAVASRPSPASPLFLEPWRAQECWKAIRKPRQDPEAADLSSGSVRPSAAIPMELREEEGSAPLDSGSGQRANQDQAKVLKIVQDYVRKKVAHNAAPHSNHDVHRAPILVHGGPGTGKTFVTNHIGKICEDEGGKMLFCAPTGVAAGISDRNGRTIHTLLGIGPSVPSENFYTQLPLGKIGPVRLRFTGGVYILVIDEISMVRLPKS